MEYVPARTKRMIIPPISHCYHYFFAPCVALPKQHPPDRLIAPWLVYTSYNVGQAGGISKFKKTCFLIGSYVALDILFPLMLSNKVVAVVAFIDIGSSRAAVRICHRNAYTLGPK